MKKNRKKRSTIRACLLIAWLLLLGGLSHSTLAQCTLVCNDPDPATPLQIALDENCNIRIVPDVVLEAPQLCPGDKNILIRDLNDNFIVQGDNEVITDFSAYVGQIVSITIRHVDTGEFCTSYAEIVDNLPPQIVCGDVDLVVACTADTSVASIGLPEVVDNCSNEYDLTYTDEMETADCNSQGTHVITRRWTARDESGNSSSCTQSIVLDRPDLDDVVFPFDINLSCGETIITDPNETGWPSIDGEPIENDSFCDLAVSYTDENSKNCNGVGQTVVRNWLVVEKCSGRTRGFEQIIQVKDLIPPFVTCPEPQVYATVTGACYATISLPKATVTDNCDENATYIVSTSYGDVGTGPHYGIPTGNHMVQYTAIDACGNTATCSVPITVVDREPPVAVCDDSQSISLTDGGIAIIAARQFDEGSSDNCNETLYFKAVRMEPRACDNLNGDDNIDLSTYEEYFDDHVYFCCEDVDNDSLLVAFRVFEVDPGKGPVDPARMEPGGDLYGHYNECMLQINVKDKIAPTVVCPANATVDCSTDYTDLSEYGAPTIIENCSYTIDVDVSENLGECSDGFIERRFTVTDASGNQGSCVQRVFLENLNPLEEEDITWPENVELNTCNPDYLPDDLPDGFNRPLVNYESCSQVAMTYEDSRFDVAYPACFKVLRRWQVIDWCSYNEFTGEGLYRKTQTIKILDEEAPVISCPEALTAGVNTECNTAYVDIPVVTATDCSESIDITHDTPYATSRGSNASGEYPLGETLVTFTASDNCGNTSKCSVQVTVIDDKAPAALCLNGLSTNLVDMPNAEPMTMLQAAVFNAKSTDNCTGEENLTFTIRKAVEEGVTNAPDPQAEIRFTCEDVGNQLVELWVTDAFGNSDYCVTYVRIQDNNSLCGSQYTSGEISGVIQTEIGKTVENVNMKLNGSKPVATQSDVYGTYALNEIPFGGSYTLTPEKNDELLLGITTLDLLLVNKHILGVEPLTNPYQMIAADIDRSGRISTIDLIKLRKIVLNKDDALPEGAPSWRFIDADYEFPDGVNPLEVDFPESKTIINYDGDMSDMNFIAIKIGDINGSVNPNSLLSSQDRTTNGDVFILAENQEFKAGETVTVPFTSANLFNLIGLQFTLDYDERLLTLKDYHPGELPQMTKENFGLVNMDEGLVTTSWNANDDVLTLEEGQVFSLTFKARREGSLLDALKISSEPTLAEAYNYNNEPMQVALVITDAAGIPQFKGAYRLYQNYPNPFENETLIGFTLPEKQDVQFRFFDMAGRLVHQHRANWNAGYNELSVSSLDLNTNGLMYYRMETEDFTATRKMVLSSATR